MHSFAASGVSHTVEAPDGAEDGPVLDEAIKHVLHATGMQLTTAIGSGWSMSSLEEILASCDTDDAMEE